MDEKLTQQAMEALMNAKKRMTYQAIAERLGVGVQTPFRWLKHGRINPVYARMIVEVLG